MNLGMSESLFKVLKYCHRWNTPVVFDDCFPLRHGKVWKGGSNETLGPTTSSTVLYRNGKKPQRCIYIDTQDISFFNPSELLHELSHSLASKSPWTVDEVNSEMLAFEYYSSHYLRLNTWSHWMKDFRILYEGGDTWPKISKATRSKLLRYSLTKAVKRNLLDTRGRPTFCNPVTAGVS